MPRLFPKMLILCLVPLALLSAVPVSAHNMTVGFSKWCFGKNFILVRVDLDSFLIAQMNGIKEGHYNPDTVSEKRLRKMAAEVIEPYINKKLLLTLDDRLYHLHIDKISMNDGKLYTIWLRVAGYDFKTPVNNVKIDYQMLFEETYYAHMNVTYLYLIDTPEDTIQKVLDYSQPSWQTVFDPSATAWEVSLKGARGMPETAPKTVTPASDPPPKASGGGPTSK